MKILSNAHKSLTLCALIIAFVIASVLMYFKEEQASHIVSMLGLVVGAWLRFASITAQNTDVDSINDNPAGPKKEDHNGE